MRIARSRPAAPVRRRRFAARAPAPPDFRDRPSHASAMNPGPTPTTLPADFHPLEIIPFFRRWRSGVWRDLIYTFIWNTAIGAVFALLGLMWMTPSDPMRFVWLNFAFAQCVGYSIHALFALGHALIPGHLMSAMAMRVLFYAGIPMLGVVIGVVIGVNLMGGHGMPRWFLTTRG